MYVAAGSSVGGDDPRAEVSGRQLVLIHGSTIAVVGLTDGLRANLRDIVRAWDVEDEAAAAEVPRCDWCSRELVAEDRDVGWLWYHAYNGHLWCAGSDTMASWHGRGEVPDDHIPEGAATDPEPPAAPTHQCDRCGGAVYPKRLYQYYWWCHVTPDQMRCPTGHRTAAVGGQEKVPQHLVPAGAGAEGV